MPRGKKPTFAERRAADIVRLRAQLDAGVYIEPEPAASPASPALPSDLRRTSSPPTRRYSSYVGETFICVHCGRSHERKNRLRLIRPMMDLPRLDIVEAWPCFYDHGASGYSKLMEDLALLREREAK